MCQSVGKFSATALILLTLVGWCLPLGLLVTSDDGSGGGAAVSEKISSHTVSRIKIINKNNNNHSNNICTR